MSNPRESESTKGPCSCPYCEASEKEPFPFCSVCGREVARCPSCKCVLKTEDRTCPNCGVEIGGAGS